MLYMILLLVSVQLSGECSAVHEICRVIVI